MPVEERRNPIHGGLTAAPFRRHLAKHIPHPFLGYFAYCGTFVGCRIAHLGHELLSSSVSWKGSVMCAQPGKTTDEEKRRN